MRGDRISPGVLRVHDASYLRVGEHLLQATTVVLGQGCDGLWRGSWSVARPVARLLLRFPKADTTTTIRRRRRRRRQQRQKPITPAERAPPSTPSCALVVLCLVKSSSVIIIHNCLITGTPTPPPPPLERP